MKKMLQVTNVDFTVEKLLMRLIKESEKEYEVHVCCVKGKYSEALESKGMIFKYVDLDRNINPISNLKTIKQLYEIMKKEKYDIVHVHTPVMSVLARIAAKMAGVKTIIYTAHGFYFHEGMKKYKFLFFLAIEKFMGKFFTDYIFTQSYEDFQFAISRNFKSKDKILCISNGIDLTKYNENSVNVSKEKMRKNWNINKDDKIICFIGRLVKEKGILDLLEAFKKISNKRDDIYLIVVGDNVTGDRDSTFKREINVLLEDKKLKDKIRILGLRNDIPNILNASDVFCLPSYREGMPRSIIEAMAMKNAIIATNIRGCREEVVNGVNGYLVNVNSPEELEESIEMIFKDKNILAGMKEKSIERAEELYDEKKVVEKQLKVFKELLDKRG